MKQVHKICEINPIKSQQIQYYKNLYNKYKGTTMAVSSESLEHKKLRFEQISKVFTDDDNFSIHEIGMGLADYYSYIMQSFSNKNINYSGSDIVEDYVAASSEKYPKIQFYLRDISEKVFTEKYDYVIMSGIFHQRSNCKIREWEKFICKVIKNSFQICNKGISFNLISPYVDYYQEKSYYSNIYKFITFINDELSRFFEIRHNYPLFEYTICAYKQEHIKAQYAQIEFQKYL